MGRLLLVHGRLVLAENAELVLDFHLLNKVVSHLKNIRTNAQVHEWVAKLPFQDMRWG